MKTLITTVLLCLICSIYFADSAFGGVAPGTSHGRVDGNEELSSSGARPIGDKDPKAPVVTPDAIYHINDENAVFGAGHSAAIIPNIAAGGCTYFSYGGKGHQVTAVDYNNITDAFAKAKAAGYTREEHWACTPAQAVAAGVAAWAFNNTQWTLLRRNCWHMVFAALQAAGTNAVNTSSVPNTSFTNNLPPVAAGTSKL